MKKILSLGVAAAIASMTAVAASAAFKPELIDGDYTEGSTVTFEIKAYEVDKANFKATIETAGLELVDADVEGMGDIQDGVLVWVDGAAPEDGDVIATLTYNVTAAAGEKVSLALTPAEGYEGYVDATLNIEADVIEATTGDDEGGEDLGGDEGGEDLGGDDEGGDIIDGGDEGGEDLGGDEGGEDLGGDDAGSTEGGDDENKAENPDTGIALAVVPAVLAGAAIVVSKKRK